MKNSDRGLGIYAKTVARSDSRWHLGAVQMIFLQFAHPDFILHLLLAILKS